MNTTTDRSFQVGDAIKYTGYGRKSTTGNIVELDDKKKKARIHWHGTMNRATRTWVSFKVLIKQPS